MNTYTIAFTDSVLLATVVDGSDIDAVIKASVPGDVEGEIEKVSGLVLTDDLQEGDEIVWSGNDCGYLTDEHGSWFNYAVRRA